MARIFGIDAASFQGNVNWAQVDRICDFGAEKVTEGTSYTNPFWPAAKQAMLARAKASGFVPLAYMFLDAVESGTAQANHFHDKAGNLAGFGLVIDVERAPNGTPTLAQAREAAQRLRQLYPSHPIGGYIPHWFSGARDVTFVDWTWASQYVGGSGDPGVLYFSVFDAWWSAYGGRKPTLLQFTNRGVVGGVNGQVDCSAFMGTAEQFGRIVLPRAVAPPPPPPAPKPVPSPVPESQMLSADATLVYLEPGAPKVSFPVHAQEPAGEPKPWTYFSLVFAGDSGAVVQAVLHHNDGTSTPVTVPLFTGKAAKVSSPKGWGDVAVVTLHRLDSKAALGATARFITW